MSFEVGSVVFYDKGLTKGLLKGEEVGLAIVYKINSTGVYTIKYLNESREVHTKVVDTNINTNVIRFAVTDQGSHQVISNVQNKEDDYFSKALLKLNGIMGGNRNSKRRKSRRHKKTNRRRKSKRYKTNRYHRKY